MKKLLILLALAATLLIPAVAHTGNPNAGGVSWSPAERWTQICNDQESVPPNCVTDTPTENGGQPCTWGDEDDIADTAYGKLSSRQTTSDTLCLITDPCNDFACPHIVDYYATGTGLAVTLTDSRGNTYAVPPAVRTKQGMKVQDCFVDPYYTGSQTISDYPTISGTNGGYGYLTKYTLTVTATKTTQFSGGLEIAQNDADGRYGYWHLFSNVPCQWRN